MDIQASVSEQNRVSKSDNKVDIDNTSITNEKRNNNIKNMDT